MEIGDLVAAAFWVSLASTLLAIWGVWHKFRPILFVSTVVSLPCGFILSGYPLTRYFFLLPLFHFVAMLTLQGSIRWVSWAMLSLVVGFAAWFWLLRVVL